MSNDFPLTSLLTLYLRGPNSLYLDNLLGFRLLVNYLGPKFSHSLSRKPDKLLMSWEIAQIAGILNLPQSVVYAHSLDAVSIETGKENENENN